MNFLKNLFNKTGIHFRTKENSGNTISNSNLLGFEKKNVKAVSILNKNTKLDSSTPRQILDEIKSVWRTKSYDEALSLCEQTLPLLDNYDKNTKGWFWLLRGYIIKDKYGLRDPRFREYCMRSLIEDYQRNEAWYEIEGLNPFSQKTYFEAMVNTIGIDDLKARLFDNVKFEKYPIDWNQKIVNSFPIKKPIYFLNEKKIIDDLKKNFNPDELSLNAQWNLSLCLSYGSEHLANTTAQFIVKIIEKHNKNNSINWMLKTMLSSDIPSGIIWNAGARGVKRITQESSTNANIELCKIVEKEIGFNISDIDESSNADAQSVTFVREIKKREQNNTISNYQIHKAESGKEAINFLWKTKFDDNLLRVVIETPEGIFCRDIYRIYKER